MNLVIVESPTKAKTISKFLGRDYTVRSSFGHIRDLPKGELGIDIAHDFKPRYVIPRKSAKIAKELKETAAKSETVTLATDEDREGEAIAWHLSQALGLNARQIPNPPPQGGEARQVRLGGKFQIPKLERIVFHEITKQAIGKALKNPRDIDMNLVDAQQARRILDRLVGYKLSPFLWRKVARGLSAGRVQSVAVRLIAEREKEIESFVSQEYWQIEALLQSCGTTRNKTRNNAEKNFLAKLDKINNEPLPKLGIKTMGEADKILKDLEGAKYTVASVEKKEVKRNPLPPFMTSTLQQTAWQKFHFPGKFTMQLAQHLYESGFITYHRTDSLNLADQALWLAKKYICENFGENYWAGFPRKFKTKTKGAQEAHEAIRPTHTENSSEKLKGKLEASQWKLYDLIWRRFIACQMNQAVFNSTIVEIETNPKSQIPNYTFRATGQILKFDGFLKVYPLKFEDNELPELEIDEILELIKLVPSQHFTQPPSRYNEATLVKTLESFGIGRPSTYAPIISTIQERNYVAKDDKRFFQPTEIGILVNDLLTAHFPEIVDVNFTAKMEEEFDEIAAGKKEWSPTIRQFYEPFEKNLLQKYQEVSKKELAEEKIEKKCPRCGGDIVARLGKYGKFYACSTFPKCKYTESLPNESLGIKCPKCGEGEIVEKRTKKKKIFYSCNKWPKCDFALWYKPTGQTCPKCGSLLVETQRKKVKCSNKKCEEK